MDGIHELLGAGRERLVAGSEIIREQVCGSPTGVTKEPFSPGSTATWSEGARTSGRGVPSNGAKST